MRHPAYHLRPNKAVDRFALIEAIKYLEGMCRLKEYTYYGLGGPYLEEFRLLYEYYPEIKMVSIEQDEETFKRQKFHLPCRTLRLKNLDVKSFLTRYDPADKRSIFWLDYPDLEYGNFEDFITLLSKVAARSMVKITLRAEPTDYLDRGEEFRKKFQSVMPRPSKDPPPTSPEFAYLIQEMLQVAAEQALPAESSPLMFQPVSSFHYSDGTGIFTLTGLVWPRGEKQKVEVAFKNWKLRNLTWAKPKRIDVPILSTKERLRLEWCLPCRSKSPGKTLRRALGYLIDIDQVSTETKLEQYADYHRHFPYFMRGIP